MKASRFLYWNLTHFSHGSVAQTNYMLFKPRRIIKRKRNRKIPARLHRDRNTLFDIFINDISDCLHEVEKSWWKESWSFLFIVIRLFGVVWSWNNGFHTDQGRVYEMVTRIGSSTDVCWRSGEKNQLPNFWKQQIVLSGRAGWVGKTIDKFSAWRHCFESLALTG